MHCRLPWIACLLAFATVRAVAAPVPATLPRPDGKPGDMAKKVQVYVLAGQSNMVGFGLLEGAQPAYPSIFLSPDPAIRPGRMPIGNAAVLPLKVHRAAADGAAPGNGTFIEVPATGNYLVHAVHMDGTTAVVTLDGKEVYRREPGAEAVLTKVALERGKRYALGGLAKPEGGSAALWLEQVDLKGQGDLKTCIAAGKFPWFADDAGAWTVRNDVIYRDVRLSKEPLGAGGPLSATSNGGRTIGPEVPFGFVMGTYHDEPVLLIESSIGNRSLDWDFRPPSSGRTDRPGAAEWEGLEYRLMVEGVHRVLDNIADVVPGYQGQGYEIAGFVWWQGHKDSGSTKEAYEKNLVNLIQDLRKEFKAPDMRAVIATVGFHGDTLMDGPWKGVWEAQMAVGDPQQHPELAGTVASIDTRGFWRSPGDSPVNQDYHYNHNAETYALTGDALGRAMVALRGGKAEPLALPPAPARDPDVATIYSEAVVTGRPTPEECRQMAAAVRPIILDKLIPEFVATAFGANSRSLPGLELKSIVNGEKPARLDVGIDSQLDTLMSYYEAAGITDYGWKAVVPGMKTATWHSFSFDPPETQDPAKSNRYRPITFPAGMENWFAPDFDPVKAGWKEGAAPFGTWGGKLEARRPRCNGPLCGCSEPPATLWEKEVLLMRQTFDLPPAKPGHVYRIVLGGAGCDRSGEGFAIYVNGKPLTQVNGGFYRNTGIRGAYVFGDCLPEFKGGKVTIAVINFLRYTHFNNTTTYFGPREEYEGKPVPPNGHVSLWMEEAQLPPAVLSAARAAGSKPGK